MKPALTPPPAPGTAPLARAVQKITVSVIFAYGRYRASCIALGLTAEDNFTEKAAAQKCARKQFGRQPFSLIEIRPGVWTAESGEPKQS
jgi:hypothetical protein